MTVERGDGWELRLGDCRGVLVSLHADSIDSVVTDPPYELGFMGKKWDASGVAFDPATWAAVLRVLKPGGHMLAFSGTRTYHRMVCAIEDAGFEIRDQLQWLYGSGFPKSVNKAKVPEGIGTGLKPANEPIVLARKPFPKGVTVAANVLAHGTGGINVDGCRIEGRERTEYGLANATRTKGSTYGEPSPSADFDGTAGRWPANVLLDETAAAMLDAQSGFSKSPGKTGRGAGGQHGITSPRNGQGTVSCPSDSGGASRFFYVAKASRSEREAGLDHLPKHTAGELTDREDGSDGLKSPRAGSGRTSSGRANNHPTVKPDEVMRWLCRLITPPGGTVLDPFTGSGTTGIAALLEGFRFLGVELHLEYVQLAAARLRRRDAEIAAGMHPEQQGALF